jgi:hypothetical protein
MVLWHKGKFTQIKKGKMGEETENGEHLKGKRQTFDTQAHMG